MMVKAKHWLCIGAFTLALAPAAWADEPNAVASFIENIVAQIVAQVTGAPAEIGIQVPIGGDALTGDPGPGEPEIGGHIPAGG